jgi:hypothetical protein
MSNKIVGTFTGKEISIPKIRVFYEQTINPKERRGISMDAMEIPVLTHL